MWRLFTHWPSLVKPSLKPLVKKVYNTNNHIPDLMKFQHWNPAINADLFLRIARYKRFFEFWVYLSHFCFCCEVKSTWRVYGENDINVIITETVTLKTIIKGQKELRKDRRRAREWVCSCWKGKNRWEASMKLTLRQYHIDMLLWHTLRPCY